MNQVQSMGVTKTYINNNNHIQEKEVEWTNDGDNLNIQVAVNNNGQKEQMDVQLNKDDIMDLLKIQPIGMPLTNRLQNDFLTFSKSRRRSIRRSLQQKRRSRTRHKTRHRR